MQGVRHKHIRLRKKEKRTAKPGHALLKKQNTRPKQVVRYKTLLASASGMATAQEQCISYLTYPVQAGITVTFSRGFSPHSDASCQAAGALSCMNLQKYCTAYRGKLQELFLRFDEKGRLPVI